MGLKKAAWCVDGTEGDVGVGYEVSSKWKNASGVGGCVGNEAPSNW